MKATIVHDGGNDGVSILTWIAEPQAELSGLVKMVVDCSNNMTTPVSVFLSEDEKGYVRENYPDHRDTIYITHEISSQLAVMLGYDGSFHEANKGQNASEFLRDATGMTAMYFPAGSGYLVNESDLLLGKNSKMPVSVPHIAVLPFNFIYNQRDRIIKQLTSRAG